MAKAIAVAIGRSPGVETKGTRLGDTQVEAQANTRSTFATVKTNADGSGRFTLDRVLDGKRKTIAEVDFQPEGDGFEKSVAVFFDSGTFKQYPGAMTRNSRSEPVEVAVAHADALGEEGRDR